MSKKDGPPRLRLPRRAGNQRGRVERWNRTLKEQAVYGRVIRNLADVRAAVAEFVERYNQCWRLEKLAYRTPSKARQEYDLRQAAKRKRVSNKPPAPVLRSLYS